MDRPARTWGHITRPFSPAALMTTLACTSNFLPVMVSRHWAPITCPLASCRTRAPCSHTAQCTHASLIPGTERDRMITPAFTAPRACVQAKTGKNSAPVPQSPERPAIRQGTPPCASPHCLPPTPLLLHLCAAPATTTPIPVASCTRPALACCLACWLAHPDELRGLHIVGHCCSCRCCSGGQGHVQARIIKLAVIVQDLQGIRQNRRQYRRQCTSASTDDTAQTFTHVARCTGTA